MRRPTIRALVGVAAGIAAGVAGGIALTSLSAASPPAPSPPAVLDAAHAPPVLTLPGEPVTLRYAIVCGPRSDGEACAGGGEVNIRPGQSGPFTRLTLRRGRDSSLGRYWVEVPGDIAAAPDGFSYYAVLRDRDTGAGTTVPSSGAESPHRSFRLLRPTEIALGTHSFGHGRGPDARVVSAGWGSGLGELGLAGSRGLGFVGPSSFDVGENGIVTVLDEVNSRVERWSSGRATGIPIAVSGGLADLAVEPDGTIDVLEPPNRTTPTSILRSFRTDASLKWAQPLSDRTWSKLEAGPSGPVVQQQPSEQWLPVSLRGVPLDRASQRKQATPGRPLAPGRELVVERVGTGEVRLAEVVGNASVRSWRITSSTPLGEVQLAEPRGNEIVVVTKAYTDEDDEYVVLVIDGSGLTQSFSITPSEWAESAPLARFRLAGSSLYHLGSTPQGAFVDRFDLEVPR
jgi:hypothetical protein